MLRFWRKVEVSAGCWEWVGAVQSAGYGSFTAAPNRQTTAHRFAYTAMVGPIPSGMDIDHRCRNRRCVNPSHLEVVSRSENVVRGVAPAVSKMLWETATACPKGHTYTAETLYVDPRGSRRCRVCHRERARVYRLRRAA